MFNKTIALNFFTLIVLLVVCFFGFFSLFFGAGLLWIVVGSQIPEKIIEFNMDFSGSLAFWLMTVFGVLFWFFVFPVMIGLRIFLSPIVNKCFEIKDLFEQQRELNIKKKLNEYGVDVK